MACCANGPIESEGRMMISSSMVSGCRNIIVGSFRAPHGPRLAPSKDRKWKIGRPAARADQKHIHFC
ncbi:hypothetical protein PG996_010573 [Apiospora saccharicola]|uniref:Uncharacterized protein n=1 Tax=Apiospora saccharicola TaxID=335842 RepID=A0ABR1UNY8_9PEZI